MNEDEAVIENLDLLLNYDLFSEEEDVELIEDLQTVEGTEGNQFNGDQSQGYLFPSEGGQS